MPLDAITQAMHLDHSQSHYDDESMIEMSGRALAKLTRLLCQCKMAKRVNLSQSWGLNRSPHEIEPLYPFTGYTVG